MASSRTPLLSDDASFASDDSTRTNPLLEAQRAKNELRKKIAFSSAILSCVCAGSITTFSLYGHLFQERLDYTQLQVNSVSIAASLSLYLPVSLLGLLCDRFGPRPLSAASAVLFGGGYLLAAFTYKSGETELSGYTHQRGWPLWVMVLAFCFVGLGTTAMYLSSITTVVKNYGGSRHKGLLLASPIAAFGLSRFLSSGCGSSSPVW